MRAEKRYEVSIYSMLSRVPRYVGTHRSRLWAWWAGWWRTVGDDWADVYVREVDCGPTTD